MPRMRDRVVCQELSHAEARKLYNRFHALKNKAKTKELDFSWNNFSEFRDDVLEMAPADYTPSTHRFQFKLDLGKGYCREALRIRQTGNTDDTERRSGYQANLQTELAVLLLTEEGTIDAIGEMAKHYADQ